MAKKSAVKITRTSPKQLLAAYKVAAMAFINSLRYANTEPFFSVKGYEVVNGAKKPNSISVPELLAIVGTAKRLGKNIIVQTSGVADGGQIDFVFTNDPARVTIPTELY